MGDQRIELWTAFGGIKGGDRLRIGRIRPQTVNGFGREGDKLALFQPRPRFRQSALVGNKAHGFARYATKVRIGGRRIFGHDSRMG